MAPSSNFFRASRPLFNQAGFAAQTRQAFRSQGFYQRFRESSKRWQSTAAEAKPSLFKRLWESEVGIKTVHFW